MSLGNRSRDSSIMAGSYKLPVGLANKGSNASGVASQVGCMPIPAARISQPSSFTAYVHAFGVFLKRMECTSLQVIILTEMTPRVQQEDEREGNVGNFRSAMVSNSGAPPLPMARLSRSTLALILDKHTTTSALSLMCVSAPLPLC